MSKYSILLPRIVDITRSISEGDYICLFWLSYDSTSGKFQRRFEKPATRKEGKKRWRDALVVRGERRLSQCV